MDAKACVNIITLQVPRSVAPCMEIRGALVGED